MITVTRHHDISMGHRVYGHESKCKHLHGHNYRIHFTVASPSLDDKGRVIDFGVIKSMLCEWLEQNWDHKMILWCGDPITPHLIIKFNDPFDLDSMQIVSVPFNPTAENIAEYLVEVVGPNQLKKTGCVLVECKVEETRKCSATYILDAWKQNEECTMLGKFYNASESFMPDPPTGNAEPFDLPF